MYAETHVNVIDVINFLDHFQRGFFFNHVLRDLEDLMLKIRREKFHQINIIVKIK